MSLVPSIALRARAIPERTVGRLRFASLAAVGALLAHDAVFTAQYGLGPANDAALARSAHAYWPAFTALTLLTAVVLAGGTVAATMELRRLLGGLPRVEDTTRPPWSTGFLHLWPRLFSLVTMVFLVQENIEHVAAGGSLPGLWVLSAPEYPLAIPVLALVTGLLAAVGGWIRRQHATLVARLVAARAAAALAAARRRPHADHPHGRWSLLAALLAHRWILARGLAGRGPPLPVTA